VSKHKFNPFGPNIWDNVPVMVRDRPYTQTITDTEASNKLAAKFSEYNNWDWRS